MTALPIDSFLPEIVESLRKHRAIVLVAEPGAGKTTRVPPAIVRGNLLPAAHPNLVMLQPRRIAARAAAERIAEEQRWQVGGEVGYQVRFENRITSRTRLRVVTEAILTRQLLSDPSLDGIGCVVLDEFHERSIHSDIALALLREVRDALRDDLLLVVMSATLDAEPVARFLSDCPIIRVPGRTFPVDIGYRSRSNKPIENVVADAVRETLAHGDDIARGDVLVFLPGAAEIESVQRTIAPIAAAANCVIRPLHGSLPFEQQRLAIAPSSTQKIVLATNIAETSLTIDGVRTVIDTGVSRQPRFDPQRGLDALNLLPISQAAATQRAGRAGRTADGRCIRLWSRAEHDRLDLFDAPDITRVDLAPTLLDLHAWGQSDVRSFGWFEAPPAEALGAAERLLVMLGALDETGKLSALGIRMQRMPVHPRLARLLLAANDAGQPRLGAKVAALLSEKDFVRRQWNDRNAIGSSATASSSDILIRLHLLDSAELSRFRFGAAGDSVDMLQARQVAQVAEQLLRSIELKSPRSANAQEAVDDETVERLVLLAYPDRVCRRRSGDPRAGVMVGGVGIRLDPASAVAQGEFFVAVDPRRDDRSRNREATVRIASRIDPAWLHSLFPQSIRTTRTPVYDAQRQRVVLNISTRYLDLVLNEETDASLPRDVSGPLLAEVLKGELPDLIEQNDQLRALVGRIRFAQAAFADKAFPTVDLDLLSDACAGKRTRAEAVSGLCDALRNRLVYPLDRLLEEQVPETLTVPTGSKIALQYNTDPTQPPILAVRLQEVFGLPETPRIANGRVAVLLHLLGPNYRPVQITRDLASFWANTYAQVRKDLRADYPRHSWPDDPTTAPAMRGAKRRGR